MAATTAAAARITAAAAAENAPAALAPPKQGKTCGAPAGLFLRTARRRCLAFKNAEILDELLTRWEELGYRFGTLEELFAAS